MERHVQGFERSYDNKAAMEVSRVGITFKPSLALPFRSKDNTSPLM